MEKRELVEKRELNVQRTLRSSQAWVEYFLRNARSLFAIPWQAGVGLSLAERAAVASSIRTFQLGETGGGTHLVRVAARHAARSGDETYLRAVKLFLEEEHRHASDLGRVLDAAGISRARRHWSNRLFRWVRHLAGLEVMLSVLLAAESLATIYYAALRHATRSEVLRRLCEQILKDEAAHVRFQCERLAILRRGRAPSLLLATRLLFGLVVWSTAAVVWWSHHRVMRAAGIGVFDYTRRVSRAIERSIRATDPRHYSSAVRFGACKRSRPARYARRTSSGTI